MGRKPCWPSSLDAELVKKFRPEEEEEEEREWTMAAGEEELKRMEKHLSEGEEEDVTRNL